MMSQAVPECTALTQGGTAQPDEAPLLPQANLLNLVSPGSSCACPALHLLRAQLWVPVHPHAQCLCSSKALNRLRQSPSFTCRHDHASSLNAPAPSAGTSTTFSGSSRSYSGSGSYTSSSSSGSWTGSGSSYSSSSSSSSTDSEADSRKAGRQAGEHHLYPMLWHLQHQLVPFKRT